MAANRPGGGNFAEYTQDGHLEPAFREHRLSVLREQCLPLPELGTVVSSMSQATGRNVHEDITAHHLRGLAISYLESLRGQQLERPQQNEAIMNVVASAVSLRERSGLPKDAETVDSMLWRVYLYFLLEEPSAKDLLDDLRN